MMYLRITQVQNGLEHVSGLSSTSKPWPFFLTSSSIFTTYAIFLAYLTFLAYLECIRDVDIAYSSYLLLNFAKPIRNLLFGMADGVCILRFCGAVCYERPVSLVTNIILVLITSS